MLCCIEQKAARRREKIPPGTKFLVKHDTILQQKEKLRIDTARLVWDNGGNKQNAKGVVTMPPRTSLAERPDRLRCEPAGRPFRPCLLLQR